MSQLAIFEGSSGHRHVMQDLAGPVPPVEIVSFKDGMRLDLLDQGTPVGELDHALVAQDVGAGGVTLPRIPKWHQIAVTHGARLKTQRGHRVDSNPDRVLALARAEAVQQ